MKTILAAVDLREDTGQVLARAAQLSMQHTAQVVVQHVIEGTCDAESTVHEAMEQKARGTLQTAVDAAGFTVPSTLQVEFGVPHACVTQAARERCADIILIGPGQPSTMVEQVLGSTADRIVRTSPDPVLVVRNRSAHPYRRVVVAMDFSPQSEAALEAARRLAPNAPTELVHAFEIPLPFEQAMLRSGASSEDVERFRQARINDYYRQLLEMARRHALRDSVSVLRGLPGPALVELTRKYRVDLIVLGSQGRNAVVQALLGSVAKRLLSEAGCDVLVVGHGRG
ncbi:MAG TPA: universal stress protein [Hyphomicrobium sp.]|nr:universal stress protein [Hyphomicrobium sp.]